MKKTLFVLLSCLAGFSLQAQAQTPRKIGSVVVTVDSRMLGVQVSANTPELDALARKAFGAHGRYHLVSSQGQYVIRFTQLAANQVKVDVLKGGSNQVLHTQVLAGSSPRNALLKAADVAVEKTNGLGLRGFFASKLAFISARTGKQQIYTSDLLFGEVRQLTQDRNHNMSPRWSADGSRVVSTSFYKTGFPDIFQIDMRSFQRTQIASYKGTNSGGRFSPDGRHMAMVLSGSGSPDVYVGNAQGKMLRNLTRSDAVEASPCFSPDGSRIIYTSDMAGGPQLFILPVGGGSPQRVPTGISRYCAEPDWSLNNRIAFTAAVGRGYQIAVYEMGGGAAKQVSRASFDAVEPRWLADGRHLVYTARDRSSSVICILDTETGKSTVVSGSELGLCMQADVLNP